MQKESYIYILLVRRVFIHKEKFNKGFSNKYNLTKLVYYEVFSDIEQAILREKQLKGGSRQKKMDLIDKFNPNWDDLYDVIVG